MRVCMSERFFFIVRQKIFTDALSMPILRVRYVFVYVRENNTHISATLRQKLHTNTTATELNYGNNVFFFFYSLLRSIFVSYGSKYETCYALSLSHKQLRYDKQMFVVNRFVSLTRVHRWSHCISTSFFSNWYTAKPV